MSCKRSRVFFPSSTADITGDYADYIDVAIALASLSPLPRGDGKDEKVSVSVAIALAFPSPPSTTVKCTLCTRS